MCILPPPKGNSQEIYMAFYELTFIARQEITESDVANITKEITEQQMLDLEREAFVELVKNKVLFVFGSVGRKSLMCASAKK